MVDDTSNTTPASVSTTDVLSSYFSIKAYNITVTVSRVGICSGVLIIAKGCKQTKYYYSILEHNYVTEETIVEIIVETMFIVIAK